MNQTKTLLVVVGTRPEAIKLAPLIMELKKSEKFEPLVVSSGQHGEMLSQTLDAFNITPDIELGLMKPNQSLSGLLGRVVEGIGDVIAEKKPVATLVQGDTTTALGGALASFNNQVPIGHVEAGLRTGVLESPFPEEGNRSLIGRITRWHFAPTARNEAALLKEGVPGKVYITGNTVIDALLKLAKEDQPLPVSLTRPRMVLITAHRRENHGDRFEDAFVTIAELSRKYGDVDFVFPVHLNPNVQSVSKKYLDGLDNVHLVAPVAYPVMVALIKNAYLLLTDSGGIQEEAPSLGVPALVMRSHTERVEAIDAGVAKLVGTDRKEIFSAVSSLLDNPQERHKISKIPNPFGDGTASQQIVDILSRL